MFKRIGFILALVAASAQAQQDQILSAAIERSKAYDVLSYLTDEIGPRLSGSHNAALAVDYTTKRFREWGIDVRNEPVTVPHWVRGDERATLV